MLEEFETYRRNIKLKKKGSNSAMHSHKSSSLFSRVNKRYMQRYLTMETCKHMGVIWI